MFTRSSQSTAQTPLWLSPTPTMTDNSRHKCKHLALDPCIEAIHCEGSNGEECIDAIHFEGSNGEEIRHRGSTR